MQATRRRSLYMPLAQMFAAWALIVAWLQLNALNAAEMATPERAAEPLPPAPESPADTVAELPAEAPAAETQMAELAAPSGDVAAAQMGGPVQPSGTSGMLTQEPVRGLDVAVADAQATALVLMPARETLAPQPTAAPAMATAKPTVDTAEQLPDGDEYTPPVDDWVWETDESGNIIARIESPQVQVRVGTTPVNIWGGLGVQDPDSPETFRPLDGVQGQWGSLTLYEDGSWNYVETSGHAPYEPGLSTETFTVQSFDGTASQVVIWLRYDNIGDLLAG